MPALDTLGRPLRNLRLSVTDRCNLRCAYCMPEPDYVWLPRADLLSFEEIAQLVDVFCGLGVERVRLTGGEPLLRRELPEIVRQLAAKPALREISLTTNGVLLPELAQPLAAAGLTRFTVSLDTLRPARFRALTRRDDHALVLRGIEAAAATGKPGLKLDCVVLRGTNDDELVDLLEYARSVGAELRFIEYMDVGGATQWREADVVSRDEMLMRLALAYGPIEELVAEGAQLSAPAERFALPDGLSFGIIASTSAPFCHACDRSRLTADGTWYTCLYAPKGTDLRAPLRAGASASELEARILGRWRARDDRGAEQRLALRERAPLVAPEQLRADPRLEMHTRGG